MDDTARLPGDPTEIQSYSTLSPEEMIVDKSTLETLRPKHVAQQILNALRKSGGGGEPGDDGFGAAMSIKAKNIEDGDETMSVPDIISQM